MPQAAIIGAGPAGCVAAIMLARGGWEVALVEQHRFPRDKVCGECLSSLAIDLLQRLDLPRALEELGPVELKYTRIHAPAGSSIRLDLPQPMLGLSRRVFDQLLLNMAARAGATLHQPARCEQIESNGSPSLLIRDLERNRIARLYCDWILLADGKAALPGSRPPATGDFGIKAHFLDVDGPRNAIELFGLRGCYAGIAAIERGQWNAAFSVPQARIVQYSGDLDAMFDEMMHENSSLAQRMRGARRIGDWLTAPLPRFALTNQASDRVIPIGNAACAIEPIGGEGIGLAMLSAELAATMLLDSHSAGRPPNWLALRDQFAQLWQTRRLACRAAARAISCPPLADFALPALDGREPLLELVLQLTGKSG